MKEDIGIKGVDEQVSFKEEALKLHKDLKGKIGIKEKITVNSLKDLSLVYTPGVAEPCKQINENPEMVYEYTGKGNAVAVVTDGSAVLGLGDIGPKASLPVMEGKCLLFKSLANIDAYPIALETDSPEEIIKAVKQISPGFGGINLEDIKAPYCFRIENTLKDELDIPVFHDDQHGTAIVVLAGLINALKLVKKNFEECKIVVNGAGSAGIAVTKLLSSLNIKELLVCDLEGLLYPGCPQCTYPEREDIARATNPDGKRGKLSDVIVDADIFIGLSGPNVLDSKLVSRMNSNPIIMALANPEPEIIPEEAKKGGAKVVLTGRSDFPNQINNVSAFPGIFRGALDVNAKDINKEMIISAAHAIADLIAEESLNENNIVPEALDSRVVPSIAKEVSETAVDTGVARVKKIKR